MTNKHDSARERNSKDANPTQKDAAQRRGDSSYYDVRTALRRRVCEGPPPEMQYTAAVLFEYLNQDLWKAAGAMAAWPTSRALAHNCRTKSKSAADRALAEIVKRDLACELPVPRSALPGERDDGRGRPRNVLIFKFPPAEYFDTAEAANNAANLSRSRWDKIQANLSRLDGTKKDDVLSRLASYFVPFGDMFCPTKRARNMAFLRQNPEAAARLGFDGDEGDVA